MCTIQKDLNLNNLQTYKLAEDMRLASISRKIIVIHLNKKLYEINHVFDSYFEELPLQFVAKLRGKLIEQSEQCTVVCNNILLFIDSVIEVRKLDVTNTLMRIGMDGGGGVLKICLSIFDLNQPCFSTTTLSKEFLDSVVKKVFIIGIVPEVQENYKNLKTLWLNAHINLLDRAFTIATDLKLCNILLGLMSLSSMHPCCLG